MVRSAKTETTDGRLVRSAAWIDRKLMPVFGAPPVSTDDGVRSGGTVPSCPVCGHPMGEHSIDHSTPNALLECPAPIDHSLELENYSPLDELGMPVREPRRARAKTR
ncbi:hypothetical protein D9V29_04590 [Mycetocola manganoxydans]|uniref:Uncharacterized protein n=1 Tax=Mycetocola manganoxydans TaxID=699879 RepID=A0A3L6ZWN6_9MICO|nr:hypothetical protein [Mycetocola manganoxydans]RLP72433.1 hypothetical protein D9V29_04590 [Mycetocola manganoxydans]GHD40350.1 hypothetical protein GCM10008097_04400 [Mycetocola manganoxydans]